MIKTIIGIAVFILLAGAGYLFLNRNSLFLSATSNNQPISSSLSPATGSLQDEATITYTDKGFSPSTIKVKIGDTVKVKNTSSRQLLFDSDPHPAHTDDEELNIGEVGSGQTKTFVVNKMGTFGFHNHALPIDTASITIQ